MEFKGDLICAIPKKKKHKPTETYMLVLLNGKEVSSQQWQAGIDAMKNTSKGGQSVYMNGPNAKGTISIRPGSKDYFATKDKPEVKAEEPVLAT